jgi:hypothetical protein
LTVEETQPWILDSIFLLSGGYWYTLGNRTQTMQIASARDMFMDTLAFLEENEMKRVLDIGFNLYVMQRPTGAFTSTHRKVQAFRSGIGSNDDTALRLDRFASVMAASVISASVQDTHNLQKARQTA